MRLRLDGKLNFLLTMAEREAAWWNLILADSLRGISLSEFEKHAVARFAKNNFRVLRKMQWVIEPLGSLTREQRATVLAEHSARRYGRRRGDS